MPSATADRFAMGAGEVIWRRKFARKFDPSQPRDEQGRWTVGDAYLAAAANTRWSISNYLGHALRGKPLAEFDKVRRPLERELTRRMKSGEVVQVRSVGGRQAFIRAADLTPSDVVVHRHVQKYDESEPRDEHGRWTATGDAAGTVDTPSGPRYHQPDGTLTRWPDLKTAVADYSERHPATTLELEGAKPIEAMAALDQLDKLQQQFGAVPLLYVGLRPDLRDTINYATADDDGSINLNPKYWAVGGQSLYQPSSNFHPQGADNPAGIITHEFGHAVQFFLDSQSTEDNAKAPGSLWQLYNDNWNQPGDDGAGGLTTGRNMASGVSGYAKTNALEAFAENFSQAYTPGARGTDASETMRFWLDEAFPPPQEAAK